jgi:putative phosphoribosyl transferase
MSGSIHFRDRSEAGIKLAERLLGRAFLAPVVVIGLPRGGVPVAAPIAHALGAPLDILTVRKIGAPEHEELACGAVASGGVTVWNEGIMRSLGLKESDLKETLARERRELERREQVLRAGDRAPIKLVGRSVVLVDDGIATGATMRAAIRAVKAAKPREVLVALPVGAADTCEDLERNEGCAVECLSRIAGESFGSVGQWYDDFSQVETEDCRGILNRAGALR